MVDPPELPAPNASAEKSTNGAGAPSGSAPVDTITVNLYQLMEAGNITNNILLQAGDVVMCPMPDRVRFGRSWQAGRICAQQ